MRLRITFNKSEAMRFTGHLDLHRTWERTFRRAGLPIAYSQGFHPQPRINLACALPLGFTSQCEVLDAWLEQPMPIPEIEAALQKSLPPGLNIVSISEVDERLPALQTQVLSVEYQVTLIDPFDKLEERIGEVLASPYLQRERHGKTYDLRPLIQELKFIQDDSNSHPRIFMRLSAQSGATGRPEEVLSILSIPVESTRIHRTRLIFTSDV